MKSPTISVIVPAYNVAAYVRESLQSLAGQTVLPDEVIIIDDGSLDETLDVIKAFPHPYPVRILSTENRGQGPARNMGISLSRGDYVYFFDADDILSPEFVGAMKDIVEKSAFPDIVFFSGDSFRDHVAVPHAVVDYRRGFSGAFHAPLDLLRAFDAVKRISCSPCLYLSRRSLWVETPLAFIEHYHEDEHILYPLILSAASYLVADDCYFSRRVRHGSTMMLTKSARHLLGYRETIRSLLQLHRDPVAPEVKPFIRSRAVHFMKKYIFHATRNGIAMDVGFLVSTILGLRSVELLAYVIYRGGEALPRAMIRRVLGAPSGVQA
ncbi:Putative glycosyltransferase EpsH [Halomonas sp. THAF5a]|uniref:glycosyltransferase family 2 protein n=1 Tax=Halomonas sp. THAF5a TaxID=2587844 RepID=UPI0012A82035|nr:glycosyltransferase family 2 protein [Halomonas sp. THAF5a]QFU01528.1 Putative glycosyltransferase EpsH [Halomonas sp. THAF5a]